MNYSRRVAAWLFALPVVLAALCGRVSKLEMISFWLLCWKLLRATSGLKRIKDRELTEDSCPDSDSTQHTLLAQHASHTPLAQHASHTPLAQHASHTPLAQHASHTPLAQHASHTSLALHTHKHQQQQHLLSSPVAMETSSTASLIGCWAETEDYGKGNESYPAGRGAEEDEEEEPGDGPIVEEESKDEEEEEEEEEGRAERGGGGGDWNLTELRSASSLFVGGEEEEKEEEEKEKEQGEEPPCKVEDLQPEDMDESSPAPSAVAGETETQAASEQRTREEASSGHDPDDLGDLGDCLRAEMAIVSSDSDADDAANKEGETSGGGVRDGVDPPLLEQPESPAPACRLQTSSPQAASGLTLIPEVEEGGGAAARRPPDTDRRLPRDYCVLQENRSENVDPEHLDFLGVRQQWRQLELEVKGQAAAGAGAAGGAGQLLPQPGGHSFLYTPVKSVERPESRAGEGLQLATLSPCSEDSGVGELSGRTPPPPSSPSSEEPENPVEREIRLTMEREESFRRERSRTRPAAPHHPPGEDRRRVSPGARTPTFSLSPSLSPSPSPRPVYHEMSASNVIILEPDSLAFPASPQRQQRPYGPPLLSPGPAPRFSDWPPSDAPSVIILETSNLIIRSASEFCLSSGGGVAAAAAGGGETVQESTFSSNPFFKLRSRSSMSLVEQEIRAVRQREEEWRRQRAQLPVGGAVRERYDTVLVSPNLLEGFSYERTEMPVRCASSPSSPSRTRKMDRSALSCDQRFPASLSSVSSSSSSSAAPRRQNAMAQRWEAGLIGHSRD